MEFGTKFRLYIALVFLLLLAGAVSYVTLRKQQENRFLKKRIKILLNNVQTNQIKYDSLQLLYEQTNEDKNLYWHTLKVQRNYLKIQREAQADTFLRLIDTLQLDCFKVIDSLNNQIISLQNELVEWIVKFGCIGRENDSLRQELEIIKAMFKAIEDSSKNEELPPLKDKKMPGWHFNLG